ncbi:hypothetical protein K493DRAFT_358239 [Basidiobolus meristosporus CBS 931.73]|uniref:SNRNP25 ubiquitin-like domain-containing protein n=1 Tax=Basidiobolus meristosporus CBS 931.73 TaxID=1314790 RepID=A0A1Y1XV56_9FUNG|nr:hypothetical protein K493DRAFT_358239 [Basidiobolus meristosporus CBS 931.73]|eukprot:ORX89376.1 hypothetical protein K493DRAFT_358239 [Basidiobolus meristosporus CBS 931.73]
MLSELLKDPVLSDMSHDITLEEVQNLVAYEMGNAYHIIIDRGPLSSVDLYIKHNARVKDIKSLLKVKLERENKAKPYSRKIKWKYIWRCYCLVLDGQKLLSESQKVGTLGLKNGSILKFTRYIKSKKSLVQ